MRDQNMREGPTRGPPDAAPSPTVRVSGSKGERVTPTRLVILPTLAAPAEVRAFVREVLVGHQRLSDLLLGASELVTNAVRHGGAPEDSQLVVVIESNAHSVRLEVSYPGPLFVAPAGLPAPDVAAGRGLAIVDTIADRWGITQSEGMVVWFEIDH